MSEPSKKWRPKHGAALSPREVQVLRLIADGHAEQAIATHLAISVRTVRMHRKRLEIKTGYEERVPLTRYALAHGLVPNVWPPHSRCHCCH